MSSSVSRAIAGCFALAAFATAILAGVLAHNPTSTVLVRALLCMLVCYPVGLLIGLACDRVIRHHVENHAQRHPLPAVPHADDAEPQDADALDELSDHGAVPSAEENESALVEV
jgi:hypothetical protein